MYDVGSRSRDVDSFERATRLRILGWSLVGAFMGFLLGVFLSAQGDGGPGTILLTTALGWSFSFFGPLLIMNGAGRVTSTLHAPSGKSTPRRKEYSLAESYVARGLYEEAVTAFEVAITEDATDPTPYLRIARLKRDRTGDLEGAARWFKRALSEPKVPAGVALLTRQELVELYEGRMGQPGRALPLLARIAEEVAGTTEGDWAATELARIKARLAGEPSGTGGASEISEAEEA